MTHNTTRRMFLQTSAALTAGAAAATALPVLADEKQEAKPLFKISIAEWSFNKLLFPGKMDHLDFAKVTKEEFGLDGIEYVNQFFKDKARDEKYLAEMKKRAEDHGVKSLIIMVDGEGALGDPNTDKRKQAVENHVKWLEAARYLGCHSIRVNARSGGSYDEQLERAADGLASLSEKGAEFGLNVIVENHGGLSSNGQWLAAVMKKVGKENCGTLPDFGNFHDYDRYKGVEETMPFAKAVSAKSHAFDDKGNETKTDYLKMMKIVLAHDYHGYVGIEYEGKELSPMKGVQATLDLLKRVREELS